MEALNESDAIDIIHLKNVSSGRKRMLNLYAVLKDFFFQF